MTLPAFKYHPDPIASGSIVPSDAACRCCNSKRGYVYAGAPYCEEELAGAICPWCIADGAAHAKFDALFTDDAGFPDGIPQAAIDEVTRRTPGFSAFQPERWLCCCNDAAAFLEPAGHDEIRSRYPMLEGTLVACIVQEMGLSGSAAHQFYRSLDRDKGPTAYVFQCRHCDNRPVYIDTP